MDEELKEIRDKLNSFVASESILQHLVFSVFDAITSPSLPASPVNGSALFPCGAHALRQSMPLER